MFALLQVQCVAFTGREARNVQLASGGTGSTVRVWAVPEVAECDEVWTCVASLDGHAANVKAVAFSPDGKQLACSSGQDDVYVWEVAGGAPLQPPGAIPSLLMPTVMDADAATTAGVAAAGNAADSAAGATAAGPATAAAPKHDGHTAAVTAVAWSCRGELLASAAGDGTARVWDTATGKCVVVLKLSQDQREPCVAVSSDFKVAAGCADKTIRVWEGRGKAGTRLKGHEGAVNGIAFSPDGGQLASASSDFTVMVWDVRDVRAATGRAPVTLQVGRLACKCCSRPLQCLSHIMRVRCHVKSTPLGTGSVAQHGMGQAGRSIQRNSEAQVAWRRVQDAASHLLRRTTTPTFQGGQLHSCILAHAQCH